MFRFLVKRLIIILPALFIVHFFGYAYAYGATPAAQFAGQQQTEALFTSYKAYLDNALQGNFGSMPGTVGSATPIIEKIQHDSINTLGLLGIALGISILVGMLLGFRAARTDPPSVKGWMTPFSTIGSAMPSFYLGSLLIVATIYYTIIGGKGVKAPLPLQGFGWDNHLILPTLVLMARPTVQIASISSELLASEFSRQYVVAARSLGYTWRMIRQRYALRNVLLPIIIAIVNSYRLLIGEIILVEYLFAWPGLGRLMAETLVPPRLAGAIGSTPSAMFLDPPLMAALLAVFAALFLGGDLIAALVMRIVDPRLRAGDGEANNV